MELACGIVDGLGCDDDDADNVSTARVLSVSFVCCCFVFAFIFAD